MSEPASAELGRVNRQASIRFSGLAFDKVLGYVFALFVTKTYGPEEFGLYLFGVGVLEVFLTLSKLGLERAMVRSVAGLNATGRFVEIKAVVRTASLLSLPLSLLLAAAIFAFNGWFAGALGRPKIAQVLQVAALALPASVLADIFLWATEGLGKQRYLTVIRLMVEPAVKLAVAVVIFLALGRESGVTSITAAYAAAIFCSAALSYAVYRRKVAARATGEPTQQHAAELLRVGLPYWGQALLSRIFARADIFLIFTFISASATAHYGVAQRTALLTMMISTAFDAAFRPAIAGALAAGMRDDLARQFELVSRLAMTLCLPACIVLALFPSRVLSVIGDQFIEAAMVVSIIAVGLVVSLAAGPVTSALVMAGRSRIPLINGVIAGLAGLAINLALIPRMGLVGAAIAYCAALVITTLLNGVAARRSLGVTGVGRGHLPLVIASLAAIAAGLIADRFAPANKYVALVMVAGSVLASYAAVILLGKGLRTELMRLFK